MAITKLTNTQIHGIVNDAYKQFTGKDDVTLIDLTGFTETGVDEITADREKFTGALLGVLSKTWFTQTSLRSKYKDVFFEDSASFGAITQMISVEMPEAKENSAWKDFVSGTSTVGQYTIFLCNVSNKLFTKSESWSIPLSITGEQWDTAFRNASELENFVNYLFMVLDNAIVSRLQYLNRLNRNNFIAQKVAENNGVFNLVQMYVEDRGITGGMTVGDFMSDTDCLLFAIEQLQNYIGYIQEQDTEFHTDDIARFVPEERLVVQVLKMFNNRLNVVAKSDTYHDTFLSFPLSEEVSAFQSVADKSFEGLSKISVKTADGDTVTVNGVVALICDKWCVAHTIKKHRVGSAYFGIEDITHYEYQFRDSYMNNLTLPAVIFTVQDVSAE